MLLSFKTALIPNNRQITAFRKASGVARHAYNWANAQIKDILAAQKEGEKLKLPSAIDLHKKLVAEVKSEHAWYYEVNKNVPQKALTDLRQAWDRCFSKTSKQPRFKKKGQHDSFYLESGTKAKPLIKNDGKRIKLPSIGWVRLYEFKRQLEYKTEKFGSELILVDRFFPSSQICSNCGNHRHKMPLKNRVYVCPDCGYKADRDLNAARNIDRWFADIFIPVA